MGFKKKIVQLYNFVDTKALTPKYNVMEIYVSVHKVSAKFEKILKIQYTDTPIILQRKQ